MKELKNPMNSHSIPCSNTPTQKIYGNLIDIHKREIYSAEIVIHDGIISEINRNDLACDSYICPGLIDAHVHIESSMLTPQRFGQLVIQHGTVAVVTDPHEIANVMGMEGIRFMVDNSTKSPISTFFTIPSCVPATSLDVSGATISAKDVEEMAQSKNFVGLSEMMNVLGVVNQEVEVMNKIAIAKKHNLPIDGHAPAIVGETFKIYANHGITTDHECVTAEEAQEKITLGVKILIREGSAARNYNALKSLIKSNPKDVMFCSDDSHPDEIVELGHMDKIVRCALADGFNIFDVLRIATIHPIKHYHLNLGTLKVGDPADFIMIDHPKSFQTERVYIRGVKKYDRKEATEKTIISDNKQEEFSKEINNFKHYPIEISALRKQVTSPITAISITDGELVTTAYKYIPNRPLDNLESDLTNDLIKIVYINRYHNGIPQVAFCKGFHLKKGAIASSIAHDSHNIIAVGCNDEELAMAINAVIKQKGGLSVCSDHTIQTLALPIAGILSDSPGEKVAMEYKKLSKQTHDMGCSLHAPFMTLSFLSLVVIPYIKIGEKGLFDYTTFDWIKEE
ncbi:MAG: adenine deaminase [Bacteroidales bacterium]